MPFTPTPAPPLGPAPPPAPSAARLRAALLWRGGGQLAAQALLWTATFVVVRLLSPADYGLVALAGVITGFLALLSGSGLAAALVQKPALGPQDRAQALGMLVALNAVLAAVQLALAPAAARAFATPAVEPLLQATALAYAVLPWTALASADAARALDFRRLALVDLTAAVAGAAASLALALAGAGVWALIAGQLAPHFARLAAFAPRARWPRPSFALARAAGLARFGGAVTLNGVVWYAYSQADVAVAGRRLDAAAVGIYSTAFFLAALPVAKLIPLLNEIGFAAYARLTHAPERIRAGLTATARLTALATFPVFAGLAATAPDLVPLMLGPQWAAAAAPARWLALAMPLYAVGNLLGPAVNALGRPGVQLGNAALGLAIMPAAFWIGAGQGGAAGIAAAWAIAYPVLFALSARRSLAVVGLPARALGAAITAPALAALAMAAPVMVAASAPLPVAARLALEIATGAVTYLAIVRWALPARWAEARALLRRA